MEQGFWLFFIFQLFALGALADKMNLIGLRKQAFMLGIAGSLGVALFTLLLTLMDTEGTIRAALKWTMGAAMMAALVATAASVVLPAEMARRKA